MQEFNLEHDATPSWSGYNYQGKVALYVVLDKLCKLYNSKQIAEIGKHFLELEWMEDFSIVQYINNNVKYKTIHQVKAYDTESIDKYAEAVYGLAIKALTIEDLEQAYLHTWKHININETEWKIKIKELAKSQSTKNEIINKLGELINDKNKLYETVQRILKPKSGGVPSYIKRIIANMEKVDEISETTVLEAVNRALETATTYAANLEKRLTDEILKKISLFKYDGVDFCDLDDIKIKIKKKIKEHLELQGKDWLAADAKYNEILYHYLLGEIDKNIVNRHKSFNNENKNKLTISFNDFNNILKSSTLSEHSKEYRLLQLKDKFFDFYHNYCKACLKKNSNPEICIRCNVSFAINDIERMDINEFEKFCRILCPDIIGKMDEPLVSQKLLESGGINGSLFKALRDIEKDYEKISGMFRYHSIENRTLLLTALEDKSIDCCSSFVCTNILNNKEIDGIFMDIDELISKDFKEESIWDCANRITQFPTKEKENDFDLSDHICHCKNVSLTRVNDVIGRLNK